MLKYIPNVLTIMRIILVPFFVYFFFQNKFWDQIITLFIFSIASITDFFDGRLARKYNIESNLGKFLDPLADKILVLAAYSCFVFLNEYKIPFWIIIIIAFREFSLTGLRMLAISQDKILKTSKLGKLKTATQMITIVFILLLMLIKTFMIEQQLIKINPMVTHEKFWLHFLGNFWGYFFVYAPLALIIISTFITLYSGVMYIVVNLNLFKDKV